MKRALVGILMGSDSDLEVMRETEKVLTEFGVASEMVIASAHRSPRRTMVYASSAERRGLKILIAGAGHAAHLAGVLAANTTLPVIGVPIDSSSLKGLDAILSTAQMPGGVPVATMAIGKSGAKNAGLMAVSILALSNRALRRKLVSFRRSMERQVLAKDRRIRKGRA